MEEMQVMAALRHVDDIFAIQRIVGRYAVDNLFNSQAVISKSKEPNYLANADSRLLYLINLTIYESCKKTHIIKLQNFSRILIHYGFLINFLYALFY